MPFFLLAVPKIFHPLEFVFFLYFNLIGVFFVDVVVCVWLAVSFPAAPVEPISFAGLCAQLSQISLAKVY